jgi:hypothetical protein
MLPRCSTALNILNIVSCSVLSNPKISIADINELKSLKSFLLVSLQLFPLINWLTNQFDINSAKSWALYNLPDSNKNIDLLQTNHIFSFVR